MNKPIYLGQAILDISKTLKDELGRKIMIEFCALRVKAYAYRLDDDTEIKKAKGTKKCIVKRELTFKNYADSLFNNDVIVKSQQRFRSNHHRVYTEELIR